MDQLSGFKNAGTSQIGPAVSEEGRNSPFLKLWLATPDDQRAIVVKSLYPHLTDTEIAKLLDISRDSLRQFQSFQQFKDLISNRSLFVNLSPPDFSEDDSYKYEAWFNTTIHKIWSSDAMLRFNMIIAFMDFLTGEPSRGEGVIAARALIVQLSDSAKLHLTDWTKTATWALGQIGRHGSYAERALIEPFLTKFAAEHADPDVQKRFQSALKDLRRGDNSLNVDIKKSSTILTEQDQQKHGVAVSSSEGEINRPLTREQSPDEARSKQFDAMLATISPDARYEELAPHLADLSHEFRQQVAARLEPAFNAHIQAMPHDDLDGKKKIARLVNSEVERFGLSVKCPKTGLPAKLRAQTGNWPEIGRFAFEVYIDGKRTTPSTSDKLPRLELTDVNPDVQPELPWQDKVGPKSSRTGRKLT